MKKILVIDDDTISNRIIVAYLTEANYFVEAVSSGKEAWEILCQQPKNYGLILVDRMMLGVDGMELLQRIKTHSKLKHIPVIMLTGEAEAEEHINAIAAGAFEFVYKPIEKNLLLFLTEKALKQHQ